MCGGVLQAVQDADRPALHLQPVLAEEGDGLGQQLPLALLHDAPLEDLRRVAGQHLSCLLQDDGAGVTLLRDKVDGGTRDLYPVFQSLLVDMEAIAAHPQKEG